MINNILERIKLTKEDIHGMINDALREKKDSKVTLTKEGSSIIKELQNPELGVRAEAIPLAEAIMLSLSPAEQKEIFNNFRKFSISQYINGKWKIFEKFFNITFQGFGRGELMALMALKGSRSGGQVEKDIIIGNNIFEVKEDPNSIRMAKVGFSSKFIYVKKIKKFYELLEELGVDDPGNDDILYEQLKDIFINNNEAKEVFTTLIAFRGSKGMNYFEKVQSAAELPTSLIQSNFNCFKILNKYKDITRGSQSTLTKSKLTVTTPNADSGYWITTKDAEKIQQSKPESTVSIHKGPEITSQSKSIVYTILNILKFSYTINPVLLSKDIAERKDVYFSEITALLYHYSGNPQPYIGVDEQFVIYTITGNQGKMRLATTATAEFERLQNQT
jgi:hypothetical protein